MVNTRNTGGDANPPNIEEIVAQAIAAAIQNMRNERNDGAGSSNEGIHVWIECFNKLKPNSFLSATTLTAASDWISHYEKLFQAIGCPDGVKARLAAFKFDGDALNWWTSYIQAKSADFVETCTWVAFREAFYKRFPLSEQQRFEREYGAIYQEERENATEYMERFLRLASFVGPTVTGDATRQARHYKWGLKRWVLDRIVNTDHADVSLACDAARDIELFHEGGNSNKRSRDGDRIQNRSSGQQDKGSGYQGRAEQNYDHRGRSDRQYDNRGRQNDKSGNNNPRQSSRGNQNNRYSGNGSSYQQHRSGNSSGQYRWAEATPACRTCGKSHTGPCRTATGACYKCGSTEHQVRNCPKKASIFPAGPSQPSTSSGGVHSLTREQAVNSSVIIDHEFIDSPLRFDDRIRLANLLPLDMLDFDLILGMDWLTSHRATILCHERKVIFGDLFKPEFVYFGSQSFRTIKIISALNQYLERIISSTLNEYKQYVERTTVPCM
ncbi:hypothetical protein CTI12_AA259190 [Artemisia annua]|uniref:CCHC-type domain-containing protein n=1 Tax=Artemisia annua TaxID=35608 RepID=A0A2U1NKL4_ARTAN|nr:hypothetical protein CTI12_AA259190 [Artemisia annua]